MQTNTSSETTRTTPEPSTSLSPKRACLIFSERGQHFGLLLLRIGFGIMILAHGISKIDNFATLSATFPNPFGLGSWLSLLLITIIEVGGGVLLVLGLLTRIAALVLTFAMCVATFLTYPSFSMTTSELPSVYLIVFLTLSIAGGGLFSADTILRRIYCRTSRKN